MRKKLNQRQKNNIMPVVLIASGVLLALALLIWQLTSSTGAQDTAKTDDTAANSEVERISLANAKQAFDQNQAVFLDVRAVESYQAGHIPGAVNIPLGELENRINELNPNQWIITYCTWPAEESSARAAQILQSRGFTQVQPVLGGFAAWSEAGYPIE